MKGWLLVIFFGVFFFLLSGCDSKTLDCRSFKITGMDTENATEAKKNWYYYVVKTYDEYTDLLDKVVIPDTEKQKFNQEFFEEKILIFVLINFPNGVKKLEVSAFLEEEDLVIDIKPQYNEYPTVETRRMGIEIEKVNYNQIKFR